MPPIHPIPKSPTNLKPIPFNHHFPMSFPINFHIHPRLYPSPPGQVQLWIKVCCVPCMKTAEYRSKAQSPAEGTPWGIM